MIGTPAANGLDCIYFRGSHYDARYQDYVQDVPFWRTLARSVSGDVLELACGTGRIAVPLACDGARVVGVDAAPSMLERAASKAAAAGVQIRLVLGDMRELSLGGHFGLIILACSGVAHLLQETDLARCLASVRSHLDASGVFAMDVLQPTPDLLSRFDGELRERFSYPNPEGPGLVVGRGSQRFDASSGILTDELSYTFTADGRAETAKRVSRLRSAREFGEALAVANLQVVESFGDFAGAPLTAGSPQQIYVCRAAS